MVAHQPGRWGLARSVALAIGLIVGATVEVQFLGARSETHYRNTIEWAATIAPHVVLLCILRAPFPSWTFPRATEESKPRILAISWLLTGLILPWILAWLVADAAGEWFTNWRGQTHIGDGAGSLLWAVRLMTGIITYTLTSAVGVLAIFLIDQCLVAFDNDKGRSDGQA